MKKIPLISIVSLMTVLFFALTSWAAAARLFYEYGELVVVYQNAGKLKSSTSPPIIQGIV